MEADFSGYATKANLKCSDGRTITSDAFKHMDGLKVPLVWQHYRNSPENVLGHALLESRSDGVYAYAFFNETDGAKSAKMLVQHEDINALSIYANRLVERGKTVVHGVIREVSLVLSGANPGALIDNVNISHGEGETDVLDDEAVIYTGLTLEHMNLAEVESVDEKNVDDEKVVGDENVEESDTVQHADETIQDVFNTFSQKQKDVVYYMIGEALSGAKAEHSDDESPFLSTDENIAAVLETFTDDQKVVIHHMLDEAEKNFMATAKDTPEGTEMTHNVFEKSESKNTGLTLSHSDVASIFEGAKRLGSFKESVEDYALKHGIEDIDTLFPDAKAVTSSPDFLKRRTEWVSDVMDSTRHTPFSRIKSTSANLTLAEARAKGYVKGDLKQEEFFKVSKRTTTPQTVYKKQKLDRDDVLDITDFDVVAWLKGEMRLMLEEEIARAVLIGDGRSSGDDDKIKEDHLRPIASDDDLYVTSLFVNLGDANSSADEIIDALTLQRRHYRGSGNPTFYTSETILAQMLLLKDTLGRRIYPTVNDLAAAIRVKNIVAVEVMDEAANDVVGIMVNLTDYVIGADKGGDISLFDDFDIDYNQYKYLIETRVSGALVKPKSAIVVRKVASGDALVSPVAPSWDGATHKVTVATTTGVVYKNKATNTTLTTAGPVTLADGETLTVIAVPASGYYFNSSMADEFEFTYDDGLVETS